VHAVACAAGTFNLAKNQWPVLKLRVAGSGHSQLLLARADEVIE